MLQILFLSAHLAPRVRIRAPFNELRRDPILVVSAPVAPVHHRVVRTLRVHDAALEEREFLRAHRLPLVHGIALLLSRSVAGEPLARVLQWSDFGQLIETRVLPIVVRHERLIHLLVVLADQGASLGRATAGRGQNLRVAQFITLAGAVERAALERLHPDMIDALKGDATSGPLAQP